MTKKINILKDESGAVLVIALIMMVVFTMIGIAGSFTSIFEIMISGHKRGSTNAFFSADSGVQVTVANIENFDLPGKYNNNKYDPFTDAKNPNPTGAKVNINYDDTQVGAPRGSGFSATGNFEFVHYVIESTGTDQIDTGATRSSCTIQQKVVRLIPTLQGGN
ncbi:MAG: pilus assembly PilX N-terminal domain-containing protein [Thermodesulfobacteriota bacterium]|nr:pilus assembly PilX N-terminal domain-containing protein [Thermodesulfobacteriota bacterium]